MKEIAHQKNRFRYAFAGIWYALRNDCSFRSQFFGGGAAIALFYYFFRPISEAEFFFLILAWTLILITELQNSSYESALDHLHPDIHDAVRRSKDMAAGSVLLAGLFLVFVMLFIILT